MKEIIINNKNYTFDMENKEESLAKVLGIICEEFNITDEECFNFVKNFNKEIGVYEK